MSSIKDIRLTDEEIEGMGKKDPKFKSWYEKARLQYQKKYGRVPKSYADVLYFLATRAVSSARNKAGVKLPKPKPLKRKPGRPPKPKSGTVAATTTATAALPTGNLPSQQPTLSATAAQPAPFGSVALPTPQANRGIPMPQDSSLPPNFVNWYLQYAVNQQNQQNQQRSRGPTAEEISYINKMLGITPDSHLLTPPDLKPTPMPGPDDNDTKHMPPLIRGPTPVGPPGLLQPATPSKPPVTPSRPPRPYPSITDDKDSKSGDLKHEFFFGPEKFVFDYSKPLDVIKEGKRASEHIDKEFGKLKNAHNKLYSDRFNAQFIAARQKKYPPKFLYDKLKRNYVGRTAVLKNVPPASRIEELRRMDAEFKKEYDKWEHETKIAIDKEIKSEIEQAKGKGESGGSPDPEDITSSDQLTKWMADVPGFQEVIARNQPLRIVKPANKLGQRSWIMNTDNIGPKFPGHKGIHWTAIVQTPTSIEFMNSLGDEPERDIIEKLLKLPGAEKQKFKYNAIQSQADDTDDCGYHAMKFIISRLTQDFATASGFSDAEKDKSKEGEEALAKWRASMPQFKIVGGFSASGPSHDLHKQLDEREITSVTVERAPIHSAIMATLRALSGNKLDRILKEKGYDKLFHLSLVLHLEDGSQKRLEKNETVQMKPYQSRPDTESVPAGKPDCTIAQFVERAAAHQGSSYWLYDHRNNNCQTFVYNTLQANHLMNGNIKSFVMQDTESIFKKLPPWLNTIASHITGLAGQLRSLIGGEENKLNTSE